MATSRYAFTKRLDGRLIATSDITSKIFFSAQSNQLSFNIVTLKSGERLDHLAGRQYGDSSLWWIIAAASGVGWASQCPAGTVLRVPSDLNQIFNLIR